MVPRFSVAFIAMFAMLTMPLPARAAVSSLSGIVTDGTSRIAHANVLLKNAAQSAAAQTDASGRFSVASLEPGTYEVTVVARGYEPLLRELVRVAAGPAVINVTLRPATASSLAVISSTIARGGQSVPSRSAPIRVIARPALQGWPSDKLGDVLNGEAAITPIRASSGSTAPFAAALRGPDPGETIVDIDGHRVNTGATGTFDLSLIDPQALESVELVYGIAPSSLVGPDTIGGAINVRTLEPQSGARARLQWSAGSFDTTRVAFDASGTQNGTGYAVAFDRYTSGGEVRANGTGSSEQSGTGLVKLRAPIDRGRGFAQITMLDQASNKDISSSLSSIDADGTFTSFAGSAAQAHDTLYGIDLQLPVGRASASGLSPGTLTLRHASEADAQSVEGPAANVSESYFNYRDASIDDSIEYDRFIGRSTMSAQYDVRTQRLLAPYTLGGVTDNAIARGVLEDTASVFPSAFTAGEADHTFALRYLLEPAAHLHYSAAVYSSNFGSFGYSLNPRFGFVWTPSAQTAVRVSGGTTLQAPLLTELYVPSPLPPVDANGSDGTVAIGNPHLQPDRATEFDAGISHVFGGAHPLILSADAYETNLRNAIEQFVPETTPAYTFPINAGDVRYRGAEIEADETLGGRLHVLAEYVVNSAFPLQVPPPIQNGTLVAGRQFLGTPLHRASLRFERASTGRGISFGAGFVYEGAGNELNRPPFALVHAHVTESLGGLDITVFGTNLTNVYADGFTIAGGGIPYAGASGPIPTNALALPARSVVLSISRSL